MNTRVVTLKELCQAHPAIAGDYAAILSKDQFIGRKDKNGVEIYKGDIMRWGQEVGQVFWQWRQLTFLLKRADGTYIQPSYVDAWSENMEVVGNIYDHPGLL